LGEEAQVGRKQVLEREWPNGQIRVPTTVLAEEAYVYSLLRPERATFVLQRRGRTGPWTLADLRCHGNTGPSATTLAFVEAWLREQFCQSPAGKGVAEPKSASNGPQPASEPPGNE
jgi:hypothetical protein